MFVLFHGTYNSSNKQIIGIYTSINNALARAKLIVAEDAMTGMGKYAPGPGIAYPADSGVLFRGQHENPYCLWVKEIEVDA